MPTPSHCLETLGGSGGRGEERVTGGASRTARLQYLSAPEPGGHQPRNRHDVNDPLLLALQKELTSNLLWVLVILLLPQQSAQWAPKRMGPGATDTDPKATRPRPKATATSRRPDPTGAELRPTISRRSETSQRLGVCD